MDISEKLALQEERDGKPGPNEVILTHDVIKDKDGHSSIIRVSRGEKDRQTGEYPALNEYFKQGYKLYKPVEKATAPVNVKPATPAAK